MKIIIKELSHTILTWKNNFDLGNDHNLEVTLGRQVNDRKEFGGHGEEEGMTRRKVTMIMTMIMKVTMIMMITDMEEVVLSLIWNL